MKSKLLRMVRVAAAAALALALLAVGASHLIYGRSVKATVYEWVLRKRYANDRTAAQEVERLEARRAAGETPYRLPERVRLKSTLRETAREGMQVFTLNDAAASDVTVLYLHGGAYINPFNAYQWRFMDRLAAEAGCRVVAPAYHLAPFADCARAYGDLSGLYRDLLGERPGDRLILMGDSAGGGLALGLAQYLAQAGDPPAERLILFSPWVDVSMDNPEIEGYLRAEPILHLELMKVHGRFWAGEGDVHDPQVSPLYGDMAGLPPVTIYCGTREILYPDILLAYDKLRAAGVDAALHAARGLNHDYPLMPLPEAEATVKAVVAAVGGRI